MSLHEVKHQARAQQVIQRALLGERLPHAYIFHGPAGVGKEMLARGLAQLLLCGTPEEVSLDGTEAAAVGIETLRVGCGSCEDCLTAAAGTHPDLHVVHRYLYRDHPDADVRKRKGLDISVDVLRHFVIEKVGRKAMGGRAKVFIIREADRITVQAQNALLKTLEEPPGATFLILLATNAERLLETTRSRCQMVPFDALPGAFVAERLADLVPELSADTRAWYAQLSQGRLGEALAYLEDDLRSVNERLTATLQGASLAEGETAAGAAGWLEMAKALGQGYKERDPDITETEATRRGLGTLLHLAANWYGDVLRAQMAPALALSNALQADAIAAAANRVDAHQAGAAIRRLAETQRHLEANANPQLCIESLLHALSPV
jgi:DNA polymerase-3 subunit delta'